MLLKKHLLLILGMTMSMLFSLNALAAAEPPIPETFATHKVVLQISDPDPFKQTLVLNVANNLMKHYDAGDLDLEIVAFGPGMRLMLEGNANTSRIQSLMASGVRFSGCANTLKKFTKIL
ncbi:hypothetical protein [Thiomicrospira sp. WB1]|uniref:DsrE family protein n=1 Tax=Thiomicrospira sp. WB1 TaxID=1685380 RepID=UPI000AA2550E|nr:hypothetical protein [Thiomicrospira sp. WB1]